MKTLTHTLVMSFWLKVCITVTPEVLNGIRTWFYADQLSSSTLTESIIFFLNLALYTEALSC